MAKLKDRDFDIDIFKLSDGEHRYEFIFNETFFELFEEQLIDKGEGNIHLHMLKTPTLINLLFSIKGTVELVCDRSLKPFRHTLNIDKSLILKFGDHDEELDEEMILINWNTQTINVAHWTYEFIGLSLPMKRLHPDYRNDPEKEDQLLYTTGDSNADENDSSGAWDILKDLKNKLD